MNEEEIQIRAQFIRDELERMQPDIAREVRDQFGEDLANLQDNHEGVLGNIAHANANTQGPNVNEDAQKEIIEHFNDNLNNLHNQADAYRQQVTNERTRFLIGQYLEDGTEGDRQRVADILNIDLFPPQDGAGVVDGPAQAGNENERAGQQDEINYDELNQFDGVGDWERGDLTTEFNDNSFGGNGPPPPDDGFEP